MGFTDSTLFTGDIDYNNIPSGQETYWTQQLTSLTVNGNSVSLPSGSSSFAAIDTGTTLVGGPPDVIAEIFAQIPGSQPGTGNFESYYVYPCDTSVTVTMSFGGQSWPVDPQDFQLTQLGQNECLGAFFSLPEAAGSGTPPWIVGDTFLKNVYSVFRFNPPSVGFASLSTTATSQNDANGAVPSPTIGSVTAQVTAGGDSNVNTNAAPRVKSLSAAAVVAATVLAALAISAL